MAYLILPSRRTRQPQMAVRANSYWIGRGLRFLINPAVGPVNLVDGHTALQSSGFPKEVTHSGLYYAGNARAEFNANGLDIAGNSLTLISSWRSRSSSDYLLADGSSVILSCRTSSNNGWSWYRNGASAGGANGNVTGQSWVQNNVASYTESNYVIASRVVTPVAMRATGSAASWFAFGKTSSPDTTIYTKTNGGNLVWGGNGDYANNVLAWLDLAGITAAFNQPLTNEEIYALSSSVSAIYDLFVPDVRRIYFGAGGGTGFADLGRPKGTMRPTVRV